MLCPYCNKKAEWVPNEQVYGHRYGRSYMCYFCKACDSYVGCHNNTQTPLGTMANKELRQWRVKAHAHIDPLWRSGRMKRSAVYKLLKDKLGKPIHIGSADIDLCKEILALNLEVE